MSPACPAQTQSWGQSKEDVCDGVVVDTIDRLQNPLGDRPTGVPVRGSEWSLSECTSCVASFRVTKLWMLSRGAWERSTSLHLCLLTADAMGPPTSSPSLPPHLPAVMASMSSDGSKNKLFPCTWLLLGILLQQQEKRLRWKDGGIQPACEVPSATAGTGAPRKSTMFGDHFGPLTKQSL